MSRYGGDRLFELLPEVYRIRDAERKAAGPGESLIPGKTKSSRGRNDDVQVHVFLESGSTLRISQTTSGVSRASMMTE